MDWRPRSDSNTRRRFRRPLPFLPARANWSDCRESNPMAITLATSSRTMRGRIDWLERKESNLTSPSYQLGALPLSYSPMFSRRRAVCGDIVLVRVVGAAPTTSEFQARPSAVDLHPDTVDTSSGVEPPWKRFAGVRLCRSATTWHWGAVMESNHLWSAFTVQSGCRANDTSMVPKARFELANSSV
jgi:hypothetical protein